MSNQISDRLNKVLQTLNSSTLAKIAHTKFVSVTPIRSGNARRNTKLNGNSIDANYAYAKRLDEGYSKQAPKGMTEPTLKYVKDYIYQQTGMRFR